MKCLEGIKDENGEIVVEASFVFPLVIFVVFIIIQLGFIMYQQTLLTVVANETASSLAQIYSTPSKDPFVGFINTEELSKVKLYRNILNDAKNGIDKKAWFVKYRLAKQRLYRESGDFTIEIDFEHQPGTILQKTVVVKIEARYDLTFFRLFGVRDTSKVFRAEGRAECLDLLDYSSVLCLADNVADDVLDPVASATINVKNRLSEVLPKIMEFAYDIG